MYQIISSAQPVPLFVKHLSQIIWINLQLASDCLIIHLEDRLRKGHLVLLIKLG